MDPKADCSLALVTSLAPSPDPSSRYNRSAVIRSSLMGFSICRVVELQRFFFILRFQRGSDGYSVICMLNSQLVCSFSDLVEINIESQIGTRNGSAGELIPPVHLRFCGVLAPLSNPEAVKKFARWGHQASNSAHNSLRIIGGGVPSRRVFQILRIFSQLPSPIPCSPPDRAPPIQSSVHRFKGTVGETKGRADGPSFAVVVAEQ